MNIEIGMRYVLVFMLKNPAGFFDDFWFFYMRVLVFSVSALREIMRVFLYGGSTDDIVYNVCIGQKPPEDAKNPGNFLIHLFLKIMQHFRLLCFI